jgi:hypothetical protein
MSDPEFLRAIQFADIEKIKAAASAEGFHSFRVATYDGAPPNFLKALNI